MTDAARGIFITLEGIEGVGKSTLAAAIGAHLRQLGRPVVSTREPGGTAIGESIRTLCLRAGAEPMDRETELLLMFAGRNEHLCKRIRPALATGSVVVCDRFTDASFAYQGGGRGIDAGRIAALERHVHGDIQPDLTLLLDAPVAIALERSRGRSAPDRFESEHTAFFERVRAAYLTRARAFPARIRVVRADTTIEEVRAQALALVAQVLDP